jgi:hypothetical protein
MPATPPALDPPFKGYIETTFDSLLVFEAARRGMIPRVTRRLIERERGMVQSGAVFVFDEQESGIKRWTDGLVWSPSRILGNFLVSRPILWSIQTLSSSSQLASSLFEEERLRPWLIRSGVPRDGQALGESPYSDVHHRQLELPQPTLPFGQSARDERDALFVWRVIPNGRVIGWRHPSPWTGCAPEASQLGRGRSRRPSEGARSRRQSDQ